ncbi:inorganic diphosphatase, partial [Longibacter sp.]|uniref:inorganic diphosphatase n=1 Tax=Longibacter sp. TaxID=2045415 RepID=UPI003EBA2007
TTTKYELDLDLGILRIDRIMHPPVPYPANYGFLPQTLDEDGDPLDAMVLMQNPADPFTVLSARPVGVVNLTDRGKSDDKILCVHVDDPKYDDYQSTDDLPDYEFREIEWFFEDYQDVMHREVDVEGFLGTERAHDSIRMCRDIYQENVSGNWDA